MAELTETLTKNKPRVDRSVWRTWPFFVLVGLALYAVLYAWAEWLVYDHAERNRFFMVATAPLDTYDYVILGASHAMPLDYADFNARIEQASGTTVLNLSNEGAGVLPNRLVLDYFLLEREARNVVFVLDSFAFYSPQWNEDRLDSGLLARAPLDLRLVGVLWRYPWARDEILPYLSGFTKINNQDRFAPDRTEAELTRFESVYRPIPQIDRQRIEFLYPATLDRALLDRYLSELEQMIDMVEAQGGDFILVKPPTPPRYREVLPDEEAFDAAIAELVARRDLAYRDFSEFLPEDENYYDTDHLNRTGVEAFMQAGLVEFLRDEL